jgi:hypothetical protein
MTDFAAEASASTWARRSGVIAARRSSTVG